MKQNQDIEYIGYICFNSETTHFDQNKCFEFERLEEIIKDKKVDKCYIFECNVPNDMLSDILVRIFCMNCSIEFVAPQKYYLRCHKHVVGFTASSEDCAKFDFAKLFINDFRQISSGKIVVIIPDYLSKSNIPYYAFFSSSEIPSNLRKNYANLVKRYLEIDENKICVVVAFDLSITLVYAEQSFSTIIVHEPNVHPLYINTNYRFCVVNSDNELVSETWPGTFNRVYNTVVTNNNYVELFKKFEDDSIDYCNKLGKLFQYAVDNSKHISKTEAIECFLKITIIPGFKIVKGCLYDYLSLETDHIEFVFISETFPMSSTHYIPADVVLAAVPICYSHEMLEKELEYNIRKIKCLSLWEPTENKSSPPILTIVAYFSEDIKGGNFDGCKNLFEDCLELFNDYPDLVDVLFMIDSSGFIRGALINKEFRDSIQLESNFKSLVQTEFYFERSEDQNSIFEYERYILINGNNYHIKEIIQNIMYHRSKNKIFDGTKSLQKYMQSV